MITLDMLADLLLYLLAWIGTVAGLDYHPIERLWIAALDVLGIAVYVPYQ